MKIQSKHIHGDALMQTLCQALIQQGIGFHALPLIVGGYEVIIESDIPFDDLHALALNRADSAIRTGMSRVVHSLEADINMDNWEIVKDSAADLATDASRLRALAVQEAATKTGEVSQ